MCGFVCILFLSAHLHMLTRSLYSYHKESVQMPRATYLGHVTPPTQDSGPICLFLVRALVTPPTPPSRCGDICENALHKLKLVGPNNKEFSPMGATPLNYWVHIWYGKSLVAGT